MDSSRGNAPVVVGVDGSDHARQAVRWAARTAGGRHAPLLLVHAIGVADLYAGVVPPPPKVLDEVRSRGEEFLADAKRIAEGSGAVDVQTDIDDGIPSVVLLEASRAARMLVLGASGHGRFLSSMTLGSTAVQVSAHADCPVVVVRGEQPDHGTSRAPIVVGIDGSPLSEAALAAAFEEASLRGVRLIAVHAYREDFGDLLFDHSEVGPVWASTAETERVLLAERLAGWSEKYPDVVVERKLVDDRARHALLKLSGDAQLVVVGSRGRGGFGGLLLGSTSQGLVHHADCSVMVVRSVGEA